MQITEETILKSLLVGDVNELTSFCYSFVSNYIEGLELGCISRKKYLDFLTDLHVLFKILLRGIIND